MSRRRGIIGRRRGESIQAHLTLTTWRVPFWRLGVADLVSVRVSVLVKQDRGAPDNRSTVYNEVIAHVHFEDPLVRSNTLHKFKSVYASDVRN